MQPLSEQELAQAGKTAQDLFKKYNVSQEDQDKLYNALAVIGLWKMIQDQRKQK